MTWICNVYGKAELAEALEVSLRTVHNWVRKGKEGALHSNEPISGIKEPSDGESATVQPYIYNLGEGKNSDKNEHCVEPEPIDIVRGDKDGESS